MLRVGTWVSDPGLGGVDGFIGGRLEATIHCQRAFRSPDAVSDADLSLYAGVKSKFVAFEASRANGRKHHCPSSSELRAPAISERLPNALQIVTKGHVWQEMDVADYSVCLGRNNSALYLLAKDPENEPTDSRERRQNKLLRRPTWHVSIVVGIDRPCKTSDGFTATNANAATIPPRAPESSQTASAHRAIRVTATATASRCES